MRLHVSNIFSYKILNLSQAFVFGEPIKKQCITIVGKIHQLYNYRKLGNQFIF